MKLTNSNKCVIFLIACLFSAPAWTQFIDDFNGPSIIKDSSATNGWTFFTGDGSTTIDFVQGEGFASILVDSTKDTRNVWWALIKHRVSADMNLAQLSEPGYGLRLEARVRFSNAPRRVNMSLNTQRTTDFHTNLMEFDIPDTNNWHTISMTIKNFDAKPGDTVFGQLALMDWGIGKFRVDVDYFRADIVNVAIASPDKGDGIPYHPLIADPNTFTNKIKPAHDCIIDSQNPEMNFNNWSSNDNGTKTALLAVSGTQFSIMRWDLNAFAGKKVSGSGLLELTTHSVQRLSQEVKDFGQLRVVEILAGDPNWDQKTVTYKSLCKNQPIDSVLNSQMIIDADANQSRGGKTLITISQPALQRMIDGKTLGIAVKPLGAINASFYAMENRDEKTGAILYFNVR